MAGAIMPSLPTAYCHELEQEGLGYSDCISLCQQVEASKNNNTREMKQNRLCSDIFEKILKRFL
jgi:hypothetical protein